MNQRLGQLIVSVLAAAILGGCNKEPTTPTVVQASPTPFVADLPVPVKFKLVERLSENRSLPGRRLVKHIYEGDTSAMAVNNFYLQNMAQGNWELLEQRLDKGVYYLKYRKGPELCEIRIERMPTESGTHTQIRANIQSMMESPA
jgi:hypothetical protein